MRLWRSEKPIELRRREAPMTAIERGSKIESSGRRARAGAAAGGATSVAIGSRGTLAQAGTRVKAATRLGGDHRQRRCPTVSSHLGILPVGGSSSHEDS